MIDKTIILMFDENTLDKYAEFYFSEHTKAHKKPIEHPYHESINTWMIMRRPMMNALKRKWKDFIVWFVHEQGYTNLHIEKCEMSYKVYYQTNRRHDVDNSVPKFAQDGFVESGMIADDDSTHITKLTLECGVDPSHPRTEITIKIID